MRTDLTIRARDGSEHDIAVVAPDTATFGDVVGALTRLVPSADPTWVGSHRLRPELALGRGALVTGAVLTGDRSAGEGAAPGRRLEIVGGPGAGRSIALSGDAIVVGRSPSCSLPLPDPHASRRHAAFTMTGSAVLVRDLQSTHGTWIDGEPVIRERSIAPGTLVRVGDTFLAVSGAGEQIGAAHPRDTLVVNRPPRAQFRSDDRVIDLPEAPAVERTPRVQWVAAMIPALAGGILAYVMQSWQFLAFAALTPVALVWTALGERLHWRRSRRRAAARYRGAMDRATRDIAAALETEVAERRAVDPDPAALARVAGTPTVRLWERRGGDTDLLRVRIGVGTSPAALRVRQGGEVATAGPLTAIPSAVDLGRGAVGVAAPSPLRDSVARWILTQLATLTSPADVEIALLLAADEPWLWARWLPHVRSRIASTAVERGAVVDELVELAQQRRTTLAGHRPWVGPWLVLVIDRVHALGPLPRLGALLTDGPAIGLTALCLADRAAALPAGCLQVLTACGEAGSTLRLDTERVVVADQVDRAWADRVARSLAPLSDAQTDPATALPAQCRLADLLGAEPSVADVRARWQRSNGSASTVLGVGADGPVLVDLDRDGPHVLIAGTTGAGKSELLQTLVTGLAANHPPAEMTFLLIDYKGGAALAECAELPHTVGLVTDLDDHLTSRVLASLDSEIRRRETVLAAAQANDLASFRAHGGALPRLVLIVDEFATLADELDGFVPGLVGIAQRGRSLGLHLVLATQRPAGVVSPEIRANTALRIALRVTSAAESADVIDGPEAATIHRRTPGRAFLRVGATTSAFQSARVASSGPVETDRIGVHALTGWRRGAIEPATGAETDLRRYVRAIGQVAVGSPPARRPWLQPLPERLALADLARYPASARSPFTVPIGLVDLPAEQRQIALTVDLDAGGSTLIVGGARSGRTSALRSLAVAAAERCSPAELHIHIIDGAGSALSALAGLPHTGTVADSQGGIELAARLVHRLHDELKRRRDAPGRSPALLVLVDGWEGLLDASEDFDGGRSAERLVMMLPDAPAARATIVITGGRASLAPRLAAQVGTRLVMALLDGGDRAQAGIDPRAVLRGIPGRGIRTRDGAEFQFVHAAPPAQEDAGHRRSWSGTSPAPVRLRALPAHVPLAELPSEPGRWLLGVGGDHAAPLLIPLVGTRLLVAGPPRSGRSTAVCSLLRQATGSTPEPGRIIVAAPARSRLSTLARERDLRVLAPTDPRPELTSYAVVFVDDAEAFADTEVGDALTEWLRRDAGDRSAIVAGRTDAIAVSFRGPGAEIRKDHCGVLLQPGPVDGELLGVSLPRRRARTVPGRGILVPHPDWQLGDEPLAIQLAAP